MTHNDLRISPKLKAYRGWRLSGLASLGALLTTLLAACGGGGSAGSTTAVTAVATPAVVAQALTVDFSALANYAAPVLPAYYDVAVLATDNTPGNDPVTDKIATLGRVLFYDKNLSINNTVSCASCHRQDSGFDDPSRLSLGF